MGMSSAHMDSVLNMYAQCTLKSRCGELSELGPKSIKAKSGLVQTLLIAIDEFGGRVVRLGLVPVLVGNLLYLVFAGHTDAGPAGHKVIGA